MASISRLKQRERRKIQLKRPYKEAYPSAVLKHKENLPGSEPKYRELVELAHEGITTVDPQDDITFVNNQFARSIGYSVDELIGKSLLSFATKESAERMRAETKIRMKGIKSRYEATLLHKNGYKKYFWLSVSPIFAEDGHFVGSMGVYSDITEKKTVELKLEKSVKQINVLYRAYSHARMVKPFNSVLKGIVDDLAVAFPYSEYAQAKILFDGRVFSSTKKIRRFLHKIEVPLSIGGVKRGYLQVGYVRKIPFPTEYLSLKDERELVLNVATILCKHTEAREIVDRHRGIVNKAFTALVIIHKGIIKYVNPRFYSLFKCSEVQAINRKITDFLPVSNFSKVGGRIRDYTVENCYGEKLTLAVVMQKISYEGKPSVLVRINNVTALREAEEKLKNFNQKLKTQVKEKTRHLERANKRLQSLNDLKDEFIAITSHELRSPLTSIRGYLSLLVEDDALEHFGAPYKDYLIRAYSTTDALNNLINNILDVSRLDMGRFQLQVQMVDIVDLVKKVVDSLAFQACENKLSINFNNDTGEEILKIPADSIRLAQVFRNVLDNSIKFTKRGKEIFVNLICQEKSVKIVVTDQGVGIPKAKLKEVFDKFMQVKNTNTKYKGGVGLGLFITKRIVEMHGGKIEAGQNKYGGTTISINLPLKRKADGKKQ